MNSTHNLKQRPWKSFFFSFVFFYEFDLGFQSVVEVLFGERSELHCISSFDSRIAHFSSNGSYHMVCPHIGSGAETGAGLTVAVDLLSSGPANSANHGAAHMVFDAVDRLPYPWPINWRVVAQSHSKHFACMTHQKKKPSRVELRGLILKQKWPKFLDLL